MAHRAFAVRPALGVHLQDAEIDTQLDFLDAILSYEFPDHHLPGTILPLIEQV